MRTPFVLTMIAAATLTVATDAQAQTTPPPAAATNVYAAYDWLIGDWYADAGPGVLREHITYGPSRGYIHFSVFTAAKDGPQHLHFEGIAVWNARTRMLDYLFAVEPGSGVQESGTYRVEADGSIIREVQLIDPRGNVGTFRQTFVRTGPDSAITTLMRKTEAGWTPTFPGSEKIELKRRP